MKSIIKWFKDDKGYGFIEYKPSNKIYIYYSSDIKRSYNNLVCDFELTKIRNKYILNKKTSLF